jgi:hypothetical protein
MDGLRLLNPGVEERARPILAALLAARGVDLPMASTFLRFRNPSVFQIIDRHAWVAVGRHYEPDGVAGSTIASGRIPYLGASPVNDRTAAGPPDAGFVRG